MKNFRVRGLGVAALSLVIAGMAGRSFATDYPPADHHGADVILADGDQIWGVHLNVGAFTIPAGAEVTILRYNPNTEDSGKLDLYAQNITIAGALNGDGAGFTGGGALGGEHGPTSASFPPLGGDGVNGAPRYANYQSASGTALYVLGDGPARGQYSDGLRNGGYNVPGGNTDDTTDTMVLMGSGGAAGVAEALAVYPPGFPICDPEFPYVSPGTHGGNGGCPGGGAIRLFAVHTLSVTGQVTTRGALGGIGGAGEASDVNTNIPGRCIARGGAGGDGGDGDISLEGSWTDRKTRAPGYGAGGGILLSCQDFNGMHFASAALDTRGTAWTNATDAAGALANAGTIKIFFQGDHDPTTSATLTGAHIRQRDLLLEPLTVIDPILGKVAGETSYDANHDSILDAADIVVE